MPLSWAPKDMQACHGESEVPLSSSHTLGCVVARVVDINDVYVLLSRLVGHAMDMSKPQGPFWTPSTDAGLWWDTGWSSPLEVEPEASHAWGSQQRSQPGLRWVMERLDWPWKEKGEKERADLRRRAGGEPSLLLLLHGCMPGERRREDPTSRSWSCKVKQQTQFLRPLPPAEQTTGLLSSAGNGPPRLPTPSPSSVLEPVLWKTARLISFFQNLLRDAVLVPSIPQNWWLQEGIFAFASVEVMAFWDEGKKTKQTNEWTALCMDSTLNKTLLTTWRGGGKFHGLVTHGLVPNQHNHSSLSI